MLLLLLALPHLAPWNVVEKLEEKAPACDHENKSHPLADQEDRMSLGYGPPTSRPLVGGGLAVSGGFCPTLLDAVFHLYSAQVLAG